MSNPLHHLLRRSLTPRSSPLSRRSFSSTPLRPSFAKMTIVGRLGDVPELQATSTGQEILKYVVAADNGRGENKKTSWFRVTSFQKEGPQRDLIAGLDKGTLVYVEGNASMEQYQDSEGNPRSALNIIQQRIEVLGRPNRSPSESA